MNPRVHFIEQYEPGFKAADNRYVSAWLKAEFVKIAEVFPELAGGKPVDIAVHGLVPGHGSLLGKRATGGTNSSTHALFLYVDITVDDLRQTVDKNFASIIWHELNHVVRQRYAPWTGKLIDDAIYEGLACRFQQVSLGKLPIYGDYDTVPIYEWTREAMAHGNRAYRGDYSHWVRVGRDGRKWRRYRVGTYIVDEAIKYSKKTVVELTKLPAAKILELARIE